MVRVRCSHCPQLYQVPEDQLGTEAICRSCQHTFTLQMAADETNAPRLTPISTTPASSGSTAVPRKLGQYFLKQKLGSGAMGEVWLAHDPNLDRDAALKLVPPAIAADPERRQRFEREAKTAARLSHPNTVGIYSFGIEGEHAYLAMELVKGSSLDRIVAAGGPLPWREATRVICDAAKGLAAAHEIGLVHRDVKPANLMRTSKGITKVVDFGLARAALCNTQLTQEGSMLGTPAYMAPEQWVGGEIDARSDLYSLICTYYFLLTACLPYDVSSLPALGYQHRYEPFPDPRLAMPNLPDDVCRIVARGAQKDPGRRYQTASELVAELESLLATPASGSARPAGSSHGSGATPAYGVAATPAHYSPPTPPHGVPPASPVGVPVDPGPIPAVPVGPPYEAAVRGPAPAQPGSPAIPTYVPKPLRHKPRGPLSAGTARERLFIPAAGLAAGAFCSFSYALLTVILFAVSPDDFLTDLPPPTQAAERMGFFFGMYSFMIVMFVSPLVVAAGTTAMFRGRSRLLATIGAVASVLPCNPCCFIGLPFGIWALVLLNQPDIKAAMP